MVLPQFLPRDVAVLDDYACAFTLSVLCPGADYKSIFPARAVTFNLSPEERAPLVLEVQSFRDSLSAVLDGYMKQTTRSRPLKYWKRQIVRAWTEFAHHRGLELRRNGRYADIHTSKDYTVDALRVVVTLTLSVGSKRSLGETGIARRWWAFPLRYPGGKWGIWFGPGRLLTGVCPSCANVDWHVQLIDGGGHSRLGVEPDCDGPDPGDLLCAALDAAHAPEGWICPCEHDEDETDDDIEYLGESEGPHFLRSTQREHSQSPPQHPRSSDHPFLAPHVRSDLLEQLFSPPASRNPSIVPLENEATPDLSDPGVMDFEPAWDGLEDQASPARFSTTPFDVENGHDSPLTLAQAVELAELAELAEQAGLGEMVELAEQAEQAMQAEHAEFPNFDFQPDTIDPALFLPDNFIDEAYPSPLGEPPQDTKAALVNDLLQQNAELAAENTQLKSQVARYEKARREAESWLDENASLVDPGS